MTSEAAPLPHRAGVLLACLCAALAGLRPLPAVALDPSRRLTQYHDTRWGSGDGLPQSSVLALAQTGDGYLWVGTEQGLARFDGVRFVPFELRDADGALDGHVQALYGDGDTLWVGAYRGLYRSEQGAFVEQRAVDGSAIAEVETIHRDRSGRLWVGSPTALLCARGNELRPFVDANGHRLTRVSAAAESPDDGRLCFAAARATCLEGETFAEVTELTAAAAESRVHRLAFDPSGALWAGTTGQGLLRLAGGEARRWDMSSDLAADWVQSLAADREGSVWLGCGTERLGRVSDRGLELLPPPTDGSGGGVASLLEDREGNLWVGYHAGGLQRLSAPPFVPFSTVEGLASATVRAVLEDRAGVVWVGTAGGGLHRLESGRCSVVGPEAGLGNPDVMALAEDRDGRLWVGTGGAGVFVREGERFHAVPGAGRVVFALAEDTAGRLWAGSTGLVTRLDAGRFEPVPELANVNAAAIVGRDNGEVWFANAQGGVVRWRNGRVDRFDGEGLGSESVVSLHVDDRGVVWAGTYLGGLFAIDGAAVRRLTAAQGLCDDSVFTLVDDLAGTMWMSSNLGVFTVPREQLEAVARGQVGRVDCRLFGVADGMRSAECNGGQQPAAWRDHAGRLWFATVDGVVRVDPREVAPSAPPPVVVEEVVADGRSYPVPAGGRELDLPAGRGAVSLRYSALTLTAPERVWFRHSLEGRDHGWGEAGPQRVAAYAGLAHRSYRFRVQARHPGGSWSEPGVVVSFRIGPHFYQTRSFLALLLLAVAGLALTVHRARVAVLERRQRQLEEVVTARTRELELARSELEQANATLELRVEQAVEALRESDRMAAYGHLVAGVAHEVRHPVLAIRTTAHLLRRTLAGREATSEALDILEHETGRMSRVVDDLLELGRPRELELEPWPPERLLDEAVATFRAEAATELAVETAVAGPLPPVRADRAAILQVLLNLLHNSRRHAVGARRVVVGASVDRATGRVRLTVADDGRGIPRQDQARLFEPFFSPTGGTGLGLAIAHRLVREHGGRLSVSSAPGEGTVFTVELPTADEAPSE